MANAINSFLGNGAPSVATSRTTQTPRDATAGTTANTAAAETPGTGSSEVHITSKAAQLASLGAKLSAVPAVDAAKVARISQSLADGTYKISAASIASGLMQSERSLAQIGLGG